MKTPISAPDWEMQETVSSEQNNRDNYQNVKIKDRNRKPDTAYRKSGFRFLYVHCWFRLSVLSLCLY